VVLIGRSLGTGVATYLTTKRKTDGIILVTPYDSMTSVAQEKYPLIPIKFVLKHTFDSISRTPEIKTPVLSLVASDDDIVPPWHAKALLEKW
jgi:pimeloyl-ACP methyl ester carboxylesterase